MTGWVSDSFILVQTVFILIHGKLLRIFSAEWVLLSEILVFATVSLVCGVAHNVDQLIAGRTVSGAGAATISQAMLPAERPRQFGIFGAVFGLASVVGPLLGGVFTDNHWCFFINLPIGGLSFAVVTFALPVAPPLGADLTKCSLMNQILHMDFVGAILVMAAVTCLVLALQWGGNTKPWGDTAVIACPDLWEHHVGDAALVSMSLFKSRSTDACTIQFLGGTLTLGVAEPVFASQLSKYLRQYAPGAPLSIVQQSLTSIYTALPERWCPALFVRTPRA
ncbi:major facilitator superfamily domain-containing protein [Mycena epipterygia]|nr:major facilitator superfamily domain-containing protein [Mycena epipterygia]